MWAIRGWTFQEALFSQRRLFFDKAELLFDCLGGWDSEYTPRDRREHLQTPRQEGYVPFAQRRNLEWSPLPIWRHDIRPADLYTMLTRISSWILTYPSDVLNAFAGLRDKCTSLNPAVYHHWGVPLLSGEPSLMVSLVCGLLWTGLERSEVFPQKVRRRRGFPSWSWVGWENQGVSWEGWRNQRVNFDDAGMPSPTLPVTLEIELLDGSLISWEAFETRLREDTEEEHGTSMYLCFTGSLTPVTFRKIWNTGRQISRTSNIEISLGTGAAQRWVDCTPYSSYFRRFLSTCHCCYATSITAAAVLGVLISENQLHILVVHKVADHYELLGSFLDDYRSRCDLDGRRYDGNYYPEYFDCIESFSIGMIRLG